jgi:hypothetical protein
VSDERPFCTRLQPLHHTSCTAACYSSQLLARLQAPYGLSSGAWDDEEVEGAGSLTSDRAYEGTRTIARCGTVGNG